MKIDNPLSTLGKQIGTAWSWMGSIIGACSEAQAREEVEYRLWCVLATQDKVNSELAFLREITRDCPEYFDAVISATITFITAGVPDRRALVEQLVEVQRQSYGAVITRLAGTIARSHGRGRATLGDLAVFVESGCEAFGLYESKEATDAD